MKLKRFNLFFLIIVFALLFFVVYETNTFLFSYNKEKMSRYETNKKIFENISQDHKQNVNILSSALALDETVIQAYIKDNPELIKQHIMPIWDKLKNEKLVYEIHFFKPPATSFVNFSNFKSLGKDVSDVRKDIEWVTQSFKPSQHIMFCKTYAGLRATYPIMDSKNNMLGGLSMGKKIDWLPQVIKERTGDDSFLIYTKEAASSLAGKYYDLFIEDKEVLGDLILGEKTLHLSIKDIKDLDLNKAIDGITIQNKHYIINRYPIIDFNNKVMGYLFTLNDFEYYYTNIISRILRGFVIIFMASIIIYFITTRRLKRMIRQSEMISKITQKIKRRDFNVLKNLNGKTIFDKEDILTTVKNDVIDMGRTIEQKYLSFENQLITQLYTDDLTGLGNRNALMRDIEQYNQTMLVLFNVRSFKQINDVFGFEAGNNILIELAQKINTYINDDVQDIYRIGSDEFGILFHDYNAYPENIISKVKDIIAKINNTTIKVNNELDINISIYAGVCFEENNQLVKADMALTHAKKEKVDFEIYTEDSDTKINQKNNIDTYKIIQDAIKYENIVALYQPVVDANTKQINKYEALVRIKKEDKLLTPNIFLDIAMQTKSYHDISRSVISQAIDSLNQTDKMVSINLSGMDLRNKKTLELIHNKLAGNELSTRVVFELTETDDLYESKEVLEFIKDMKKINVKIAIDDFGTGYSNFSYLLKIQPDYLKIDGSLIKNIDTDKNAYKIVKTIVQFSKELNIKTIAEFVHNKEVADICMKLGVDEFQGYFYGQPDYLPKRQNS